MNTTKQQGKHLPSQMLRVDADYANHIRAEADKLGIKVTAYTRHIYESELSTPKVSTPKKGGSK